MLVRRLDLIFIQRKEQRKEDKKKDKKVLWCSGYGHVHKYQTHFRGFIQTDPLLSFQQYLDTVKQASNKSSLSLALCFKLLEFEVLSKKC